MKVFSRYNYYSAPYKSNMVETIKQIKKNKLSTNTKEVLDEIIEWLNDVIYLNIIITIVNIKNKINTRYLLIKI